MGKVVGCSDGSVVGCMVGFVGVNVGLGVGGVGFREVGRGVEREAERGEGEGSAAR